MAIKFDITFQSSPYAILGALYYRHVLPDGTFSPWVLNTTLGPFVINTVGGTVTTHTLNDVMGVSPDFLPATAYQFYIDQQCSNNVVEPSDPVGDYYVEGCPDFTVVPNLEYPLSSYDFLVTIYDLSGAGFPMTPNSYSISNYYFTVYEVLPAGISNIGTITVPYTDVVSNLPATSYSFNITSGDLVNPIVAGILYEVQMSIEITTSTGTIIYECPNRIKVLVSECDTYKIYTGKQWALEYVDCNGIVRKISGSAAVTPFYICAKQIPKGYWCSSGVQKAPVSGGGATIHSIGSCVSSGSGSSYSISDGAVVECPPGPGCDTAFNTPFPTNIQSQIGMSAWISAGITQNVPC
jgi:hypothetical protein